MTSPWPRGAGRRARRRLLDDLLADGRDGGAGQLMLEVRGGQRGGAARCTTARVRAEIDVRRRYYQPGDVDAARHAPPDRWRT